MECNNFWCKHYDTLAENMCDVGHDGKNTRNCFEFYIWKSDFEELNKNIEDDRGSNE